MRKKHAEELREEINAKWKEAMRGFKKRISQENSTNPDTNAIISRGQVLQIFKECFGELI